MFGYDEYDTSQSQNDSSSDTENQFCRYHFRGRCGDGDYCTYSHDPSLLPICRFFARGSCRYQNKCWFRHERGQQQDHRSKFNVSKYNMEEQERKEKRLRLWKKVVAQKRNEELVTYSATPYSQDLDSDIKELDFTEALTKMREFRQLHFPLNCERSDLSWVRERVKQEILEMATECLDTDQGMNTYASHGFSDLTTDISESPKELSSSRLVTSKPLDLDDANKVQMCQGQQKDGTEEASQQMDPADPEQSLQCKKNEGADVNNNIAACDDEDVEGRTEEDGKNDLDAGASAMQEDPTDVHRGGIGGNVKFRDWLMEQLHMKQDKDTSAEKIAVAHAEERKEGQTSAVDVGAVETQDLAGTNYIEKMLKETIKDTSSTEIPNVAEAPDTASNNVHSELEDGEIPTNPASPKTKIELIQTNILAFRFLLEDLFASRSISGWSTAELQQFYYEARGCKGNGGGGGIVFEYEYPWPELNTLLFQTYRPTPKVWAELFVNFLYNELDADQHTQLDIVDVTSGLTMEDVTLVELLTLWQHECDAVNELHTGGLLAGFMALKPDKWVVSRVAQIAAYMVGNQPWVSSSYNDLNKSRAFVALGFAKCVGLGALCEFVNHFLKACGRDSLGDLDLDADKKCACESFECRCTVTSEVDWEEGGMVLSVLCEHMGWTSLAEKHTFFAAATKRLWVAPIMSLVYKEYMDPFFSGPLQGCDPIPLSEHEIQPNLQDHLAECDLDFYSHSMKSKQSISVAHEDTTLREDGLVASPSETDTGSEDEYSVNEPLPLGYENKEVQTDCPGKAEGKKVAKESAIKKPTGKKKSVSFSEDSYYDQYNDYAEEMSDGETRNVKKKPTPRRSSRSKRSDSVKSDAALKALEDSDGGKAASPRTAVKEVISKAAGGNKQDGKEPRKSPQPVKDSRKPQKQKQSERTIPTQEKPKSDQINDVKREHIVKVSTEARIQPVRRCRGVKDLDIENANDARKDEKSLEFPRRNSRTKDLDIENYAKDDKPRENVTAAKEKSSQTSKLNIKAAAPEKPKETIKRTQQALNQAVTVDLANPEKRKPKPKEAKKADPTTLIPREDYPVTEIQTEVKRTVQTMLKREEDEYSRNKRVAEVTNRCQGKARAGRPCSNCPKKDCIQGMCRRCCAGTGLVLCEPHSEPRNILEALERLVQPSSSQDKWDDSMEYYTIVPSKHFSKREEFEAFFGGDFPTLRRVSFGGHFGIRDEHVIRVAETFNKHLKVLELGCSDSGDGVHVTARAVEALTDHCPGLIKLKLEACTTVPDLAVASILTSCPQLKHLQVSGHDKRNGQVTKDALKPLFESTHAAPALRFVCFNDQGVGDDVIARLKRARRGLAVVAGSTAEDFFEKYGGGGWGGDDFYL